MNEEKRKKFYEEWSHFCNCIDFGRSALDARAIRFMNEIQKYINGEDVK